MIAHSAFLAGLIVLAVVLELMSRLTCLVPYKHLLIDEDLPLIGASVLVLFLNLYAAIYFVFRRVWLKDTGRKLAHLDRQLDTNDTVARDLSDRLAQQD